LKDCINRDDAKRYAQVARERLCVQTAVLRGIASRHRDAENMLGSKCFHRKTCGERGINSPREADYDVRETTLLRVVTDAEPQRFVRVFLVGQAHMTERGAKR